MTDAIKLGDSSKGGVSIGEQHDFDSDRHGSEYEHMNCYYGRDRGEKDVGYKIYKDEEEYIANGFRSGEQYVYLLKDTGDKNYLGKPKFTWYYVESRYTEQGKEVIDDAFKLLENDSIRDKIDMLNRVLEMRKERKVA